MLRNITEERGSDCDDLHSSVLYTEERRSDCGHLHSSVLYTEERGSDCGDLHSSVLYTHMILNPCCSFPQVFDQNSFLTNFRLIHACLRRSKWSRGLRSRSTAARLLRLWVRIPPGVLCVVRYRSLRRTDHASRRVLPTVLRRCV